MADFGETSNQPNQVAKFVREVSKFDSEDGSKWSSYMSYLNDYMEASGINLLPENVRVTALKLCLGKKGYEILDSSSLSDEEKKKWDSVTACFNQYFNPIFENLVQSRIKFNSRSQTADEDTVTFVAKVLELARPCEFGYFRNDLVRDRILAGLLDRDFALSLANDGALTLEQTLVNLGIKERNEGKSWDDSLVLKSFQTNTSVERPPSRLSNTTVDRKGTFPLLGGNAHETKQESLRGIKLETLSRRTTGNQQRRSRNPRNRRPKRYFTTNVPKINRGGRGGKQTRRSQNHLQKVEMVLRQEQKECYDRWVNACLANQSGSLADDNRSHHSSKLSIPCNMENL